MIKFRVIISVYVLLLASVNIIAMPSPLFVIAGSNTVGAKLAPQCAKAYLESIAVDNVRIVAGSVENEYWISGVSGKGLDKEIVAIKVAAHGSSTGFKALDQLQADLAMSSRLIKPSEISALKRFGSMQSRQAEHTIAIDGLAILVHPSNPISTLTINQIAQLFSGEITNWKQLGGNNETVKVYARDDRSGTWDTFKKLVLGKDYLLSEHALRFESNDKLSDQVSSQRNAIGFTGLASVRRSKLIAVSDDNTVAMKPSTYSVATEDYPLARRLYFYMPPKNASPWVREFIEFCQSNQGQKIVESVGFVSQNIRSFKNTLTDESSTPEVYRRLSKGGERLSVNFRFSEGSPRLDNKAYKDLERLLIFLRRPENVNKQVYLVGFSDAGERLSQDLVLSRFRALAVRGQLLQEGLSVADSFGLGSFMPVASNSNEGLKLKNGRVEVWLTNTPITQAVVTATR